ncbi:hypothetical protein PI125_g13193 [Phytophthora idaei]|nr:hypothetical protein PI125_g13193 [Phytophthora idaei]
MSLYFKRLETKDFVRLPPLAALGDPVLGRAQKLLFSSTMAFSDPALNLDEGVADVLATSLLMHFPDMLRLCATSPFISKIREIMSERAVCESELLVWADHPQGIHASSGKCHFSW